MDYPEHPLLPNLNDLTNEELLDKINELQKKLGVAYRLANHDLCNQIRMAINSYQTKYNEKSRRDDKDTGFDSIIDIS
jgi:hypothetical protein